MKNLNVALSSKFSRIAGLRRIFCMVSVMLVMLDQPAKFVRVLAQPALPPGTPLEWGHNDYGQLGNGTFMTSSPFGSSLAVPSDINGVQALAGGFSHSLAL